MDNVTTIVAAILGSGVLAAVVTAVMNRAKTGAEAQNIRIEGDLSIGKSAMEFAELLKGHASELQTRLSEQYTRWSERFESVERENAELHALIETLRTELREAERLKPRVEELTRDVERMRRELAAKETEIQDLRSALAKHVRDTPPRPPATG